MVFNFKTIVCTLFLSFLLMSCEADKVKTKLQVIEKETSLKLEFLDEYVFPSNVNLENTKIGGLSAIDYNNGFYYIVCDQPKTPRAYKVEIKIKEDKISSVDFKQLISFNQEKNAFYKDNHLDLEGLVAFNDRLIISTEGSISYNDNPVIFESGLDGSYKSVYMLPSKFKVNSDNKPRHNGVFEGLAKSYDKKGIWSATEFPLEKDGEKPSFLSSKSPVRFTYYDLVSKKATKEFVYELSSLPRPEKGIVNLNGLTAILEYKENEFFVLERAYQSGYSGKENIVKIFKAVVSEKSTNTIDQAILNKGAYKVLEKTLLFDFETVRNQLTDKGVDNIEGITLGPKLANGNQSLLLISDDNFSKYGKQLNQFILLEIKEQ